MARLAAAIALLLCTACEVTLTAGIEARRDGSGFVRAAIGFDDEAVRRLGDLAVELRVDDLRAAGWEVTGPAEEPDGLMWVRAAKAFATPDEAGRVAAELSGPDGPFRDFRLERSESFLKTRTTFTGVVDLSHGIAGFSDPALEQAVGELPGRPGLDQVRVRVDARLPGRSQTWEPQLGEQLRIQAQTESWNVVPIAAAVAALILAVAALYAIGVGKRRQSR